jgi:cyclic beta-1,2-glucan synthetase
MVWRCCSRRHSIGPRSIQYTHAAAWSLLAFAALGQGNQCAALFSLLNPINHSSTRADVQRYKVEPYVVAADVYSVAPHVGRGGWTWYTGSAGWLYRAGIEGILGFRLQGEILFLAPCIPEGWPRFEIAFRHRSARYDILVENPQVELLTPNWTARRCRMAGRESR